MLHLNVIVVLFVMNTSTPTTTAWTPFTMDTRTSGTAVRSVISTTVAVRANNSDGASEKLAAVNKNNNSQEASILSRRQCINTAVAATVLRAGLLAGGTVARAELEEEESSPSSTTSATTATASDDPLETFGKSLQQQNEMFRSLNWPQSAVSPLPTAGSVTEDQPSDMQKVLMDAQKKKQIDPRTHGWDWHNRSSLYFSSICKESFKILSFPSADHSWAMPKHPTYAAIQMDADCFQVIHI